MKNEETKSVKHNIVDWLKISILLLDEAIVLTLVILALHYFKISIPLPITITIVVILGTIIFIVHKAVIPSFHRQPQSGSEAMIGTQGQVVKPLTPVGAIIIGGEHWKARSVGENVENGESVEIVGREGLVLQVRRLES